MEKIKCSSQYFGIICVGSSGCFLAEGLVLLWNSHLDVTLQSCSLNHIDASIVDPISIASWRFTCFYGHPDEAQRNKTWDLLRLLCSQSSLPWLCAGDFNEILYNMKKKDRNSKSLSQLQAFQAVMDFYQFQDLGFEGYPYTSSNGREEDANIQLRLDRALGTEMLVSKFPFYKVIHGNTYGFDHSPLLIEIDSSQLSSSKSSRIFRFKEVWTREPRCTECIQAWKSGDELHDNQKRVQRELCKENFMGVIDFKKQVQHLEKNS